MDTYRDTVGKHLVCHQLQLRVVLLSGCLALQVVYKEVIQNRNSEESFNLLESGRKEPRTEELGICVTRIGAHTEYDLHVKYALPINNGE